MDTVRNFDSDCNDDFSGSVWPADITTTTTTTTTSRAKRERIARHYSRVLYAICNYMGAPESTVEFIEALLIHHGYDGDTFTATTHELAKGIASGSTTDQISTIEERLKKQRRRLTDWQNSRDDSGLSRPVLVSIKANYDHDVKRWHYDYALPVAGLIRDVIAGAPVGDRRRLAGVVMRVCRDWLLNSGLRPPSKTASRRHNPQSQIKRAFTTLTTVRGDLVQRYGPEEGARRFAQMCKNAHGENDNPLFINELQAPTTGIIPPVDDADQVKRWPDDAPFDELAHINTCKNMAYFGESPTLPASEKQDGTAGAVDTDPLPNHRSGHWDDGADMPNNVIPARRDVAADRTNNVIPEQPGQADRDEMTAPAVPLPSPAQLALDVFASVGVTIFDESTTAEGRADYVRDLAGHWLRDAIDDRMTAVNSWGSPYMLRPHHPAGDVRIFQLDDIPDEHLSGLAGMAFLIYETSPGKRQAWLAVRSPSFTGSMGDDYRRDVRRAIIRHYKADANASGSTRWPGSLNLKYRPAHVVTIIHTAPGRVLTLEQLPAMPPPRAMPALSRSVTGNGKLPDYDRCLADAGGNANKADWNFALMALSATRGCSEAEVIEYLKTHSRKARNAAGTVRNAAKQVQINEGRF
jgi:hypothetical protein